MRADLGRTRGLCRAALGPDAGNRVGQIRSTLIDIFGRSYPEKEFFIVDRDAVIRYKARVHRNVAKVGERINSLLRHVAVAGGLTRLFLASQRTSEFWQNFCRVFPAVATQRDSASLWALPFCPPPPSRTPAFRLSDRAKWPRIDRGNSAPRRSISRVFVGALANA